MKSGKQDFQAPAKQPAVEEVVDKIFHGISMPAGLRTIHEMIAKRLFAVTSLAKMNKNGASMPEKR